MDSNWLRGLQAPSLGSYHLDVVYAVRPHVTASVCPAVISARCPKYVYPSPAPRPSALSLSVCVLALTRRSRLALSAPRRRRRRRGRVTCVFSAFQCCMLMLMSTHYSTPPHSLLSLAPIRNRWLHRGDRRHDALPKVRLVCYDPS